MIKSEFEFLNCLQLSYETDKVVALSDKAIKEAIKSHFTSEVDLSIIKGGGYTIRRIDFKDGQVMQVALIYDKAAQRFGICADYISEYEMYKRICAIQNKPIKYTEAAFNTSVHNYRLSFS